MKSNLIFVGFLAIFQAANGKECGENQFECNNGICIPVSWECDGANDCYDWSDEHQDCPPCPKGYWECPSGQCILEFYVCDGDNDCGDWSDEPEDCPLCSIGFAPCVNGRCINENNFCNGNNDCGDWSDETEEACPCSDDEMRCTMPPGEGPAGACIPTEYICDPEEIWDCTDGSDEANCTIKAYSGYNIEIESSKKVKGNTLRN